jgi:hypothetical protein
VVAVEEGSVEVRVPGQTRTVKAGRAVSYQAGQLDELEWLPALKAPPKPEAAPVPETPEIAPAAPLVTEEQTDQTPPPPEVEDPVAEWNALPPTASMTPPPPPTQGVSPGFSLSVIEQRLNELRRNIALSFDRGSLRQQWAKDIGRMADAGDDLRAIDSANAWLRYAHDPPEALFVRREVLFQKMRCLRRLGRLPEADLVRRELEALPR